MNKDNSNMVLSSVPKDANLGHFNLMQDECVDKCKESDLCEYAISANNGDPYMGTCYLFNRKLDLSKVRSGSSGATNTMFSKINTVEYSIATWIKVDEINKTWRNIIHVGDENVERFPGLWITPNNFGIHASLSTKGRGEKSGPWGNTEGMVAYNVFQPKKWHHLTFTLNGREAKIFVDGKMVSHKVLGGAAQWPGTKKKIFISDPWHSTGGFHLSKMVWYPFGLSDPFVKNIAFATFPLKKFDPKVNTVTKTDPDAVILTNGWKSVNDKGAASGALKIKDIDGIAFLDGIISGGSSNSILGYLPPNRMPDRWVYLPVIGDNGKYQLEINPNGNVILYDNSHHRNRKFASYTKDVKIYLSARFPFSKGSSLKIRGRHWQSQPGFRQKGSAIYLTGGVTTRSSGIVLPDSVRPAKSDLYPSLAAWGHTRVDVRANGTVPEVLGYNVCALEGIHYNKFNGERLKLNRGFWNYSGSNGYWSYAQVVMSDGIVYLRGLIVKGSYVKDNDKSTEGPKENKYSASSAGRSQWSARINTRNTKACAAYAKKVGIKYFKIIDNKCLVSPVYNSIKPTWNEFSRDMKGFPEIISSGSNLVFTKNNSLIRNNLGSGLLDRNGKPILTLKFNKNGSYQIDNRQYNRNDFPWKSFYEVTSLYRVTQSHYKKKLDNKAYVAVMPSDFSKYERSMPTSVAQMSYLSPPKSDVKNPYITLGKNNDFSKTIGLVDKARFIDFTETAKELRDGEYSLRLYSGQHSELETLATFEIEDGKYIEHSNLMKDVAAAKVYETEPNNNIICTLPRKYCPLEDCYFATNNHVGTCLIKIDKAGRVIFMDKFNYSWGGISLANISYVVDPIKANSRDFKYAFQGECGGAETIKYKGNGDNNGKWEQQVEKCAKACEDEKGVKGFIVYPGSGRCWCEKQHSAKCIRYRNGYKRYDYTDASLGQLKKLVLNRPITYNESKKLAEKNGGRLPTKEELKDANVNSGNSKAQGVNVPQAYDFWHPVYRADNKTDYAQIGKWPGGSRCPKYCSHLDTLVTPNWFNKNFGYWRPSGLKGRNFMYFWSYD